MSLFRMNNICTLWLLLLSTFVQFQVSPVVAQDIESIVSNIGGTFCKYLAFKNILPRKYFRTCPVPTCTWEDWSHAMVNTSSKSKKTDPPFRVILSYGHNGFGNQLWQHSVAFMIAESMKAKLYIATIPDSLSPGGFLPPNTWAGINAMARLLPDDFEYDPLPLDSPVKTLCEQESFYVADRPIDWRNQNYSANFRKHLYELITDKKPRCLKLLGYFQNLPLCDDDARTLWTSRLLANITVRPGPNDLSIYLRCLPRHYHFNDRHYYESILNHTTYNQIWLFMAPECPTKLSKDPSKDGLVAQVVRLLVENFNATRWPQYTGEDETHALLHDLAGLITSKKLILPISSWAFWAGFLSNATEIHVNAPPLHSVMYTRPEYIYHNEKSKLFYGRYNATENDISFLLTPDTEKLILHDHIFFPSHHIVNEVVREEKRNHHEPLRTEENKNNTVTTAAPVSHTKGRIQYDIEV